MQNRGLHWTRTWNPRKGTSHLGNFIDCTKRSTCNSPLFVNRMHTFFMAWPLCRLVWCDFQMQICQVSTISCLEPISQKLITFYLNWWKYYLYAVSTLIFRKKQTFVCEILNFEKNTQSCIKEWSGHKFGQSGLYSRHTYTVPNMVKKVRSNRN